MDWTDYLEHLQIVLRKFNFVAAPNEDILIWYFWDGLRPSIRSKNDKRGQDLDTCEEGIKKTIDAEVKAARLPLSLVRNIDN